MSGCPARLRDGTSILIRPIQPADRDLLETAFNRLSPESRYRRFFRPVTELSPEQLDYLTDVDHHDHEALIALDERATLIVGVGRYIRTGPGVAEPAVAVADDWQGKGIASLLLAELVGRALEEDINRFSAVVLASNPTAIRLLEQAGDATIERRGEVVDVDIELRARASALEPASPLRTLLRALAAETLQVELGFWPRSLFDALGKARDEWNAFLAAPVEPPEADD